MHSARADILSELEKVLRRVQREISGRWSGLGAGSRVLVRADGQHELDAERGVVRSVHPDLQGPAELPERSRLPEAVPAVRG